MTIQPRIELTDDLIERMVSDRAGSRVPSDLVETILSTAVVTPQRRASSFPRLGPTAVPRARWVWVGIVLALLALGAAIAGASIIWPRTTIGGGGLMVVAQVDQLGGGLTKPTSMHVVGLDEASGERAWSVDIPVAAGACRPGQPPMLCRFRDGLPIGPNVGIGWGTSGWVKWSPDRETVLLFGNRGDLQGILDVASHQLTSPSGLPAGLNSARGLDQVAWAPTSDRIATLSAGSVLVIDVGGREIGRITLPRGAGAGQPAWSPDGSAILLSGCIPCGDTAADPNPHGHVFIVPVDGSPARILLDEPTWVEDGAWSPDGSRIAYATPYGIATLDVATGRVDPLTTHVLDGLDRRPTWSPDGRRIAFVGWDDLYPPAGYDPNASWTPESSIFVVDVDGTDRERLTDGFTDDHPAWSPDGGSIVYGRFARPPTPDGTFATGQFAAPLPSVWVVGVAGGEPRLIREDATADW